MLNETCIKCIKCGRRSGFYGPFFKPGSYGYPGRLEYTCKTCGWTYTTPCEDNLEEKE